MERVKREPGAAPEATTFYHRGSVVFKVSFKSVSRTQLCVLFGVSVHFLHLFLIKALQ